MNFIKSIKFFFIVFGFMCVFPTISLHAQTAATITQLSQLLQRINTFQAQFSQVTLNANQEVIQKSRGTVLLMRPNRFRWETFEPMHQIIIANEKLLWIYDIDLKQAAKQSIKNAVVTPAQLLSGDPSRLLHQFHVRLLSQSLHKVTFVLVPKQANETFSFVTITFVNQELQTMTITNNLKQTNRFDFTHVHRNVKLNPSVFDFKPPADVEVLQS